MTKWNVSIEPYNGIGKAGYILHIEGGNSAMMVSATSSESAVRFIRGLLADITRALVCGPMRYHKGAQICYSLGLLGGSYMLMAGSGPLTQFLAIGNKADLCEFGKVLLEALATVPQIPAPKAVSRD